MREEEMHYEQKIKKNCSQNINSSNFYYVSAKRGTMQQRNTCLS